MPSFQRCKIVGSTLLPVDFILTVNSALLILLKKNIKVHNIYNNTVIIVFLDSVHLTTNN